MKKALRRMLTILMVLLAFGTTSCGLLEPPPGTPQQPPEAPASPTPTPPTPSNSGWQMPAEGREPALTLPSIAAVVEQSSPSVVAIHTEIIRRDIFLQPIPEEGAGTGVIIDPSGIILTNNHVVEGVQNITVTLSDGRTFTAFETRRDPQTDLAIIRVRAQDLPAARLGDSTKLRVGDWVVAIGNALALEGGPTVTIGIISYIGRSISTSRSTMLYDLLQTDAAINPGNSGGPLLNLSGEVIGINTAIVGTAQNIGFAISITPALPIIQSLINTGYVVRPWLGIGLFSVTPAVSAYYNLSATEGVMVTFVENNSPADTAGLKAGDVIVSLGSQKVNNTEQLRKNIQSHKVGDIVSITFERDRNELVASVTLEESPVPR